MQGNESTQNGVIRVRVSDLLFALQKRWMIIVALSLVGLTFGMILSAMTVVQTSYQTYNVNGSFAVTSKNIDGQYIGGYSVPNVNDFHLAEDMVDAVRYVIRSERVLNEVINENELLGYTVPTLRSAITVTQYNSTQILEMKLTWRNAEEGVAVWNAILRHASDILPKTLQVGSLEVINEAKAEQIGVVGGGNNRVVLLTLLGFAAGVGFAIVELLMHPTLNNVRDVETLFGLETIGVIPRDNAYYKRKGSIMTKEDVGNSLVVQNFSAAAYILRNRLGTREAHHCFYVTSATEGEGKSTVAANLAIQLSDMEHKTLLIDFDTRNPNLGALFLNKVDYEHSLNALYRGDVIPEEAITTLSGYLDLLPAVLEHNAITVDNMIVELVENLKQQYEYVILDAPPVGVVSGTLSLNQVANSVLFVIGYDNSSLPEIQSSLEKLEKSGTRVLGCIVNNVVSGRAIGMTQSADERKKNISKKAAQKKKEAEKYGFIDDHKNKNESPEEVRNTRAGRRGRKKKEKSAPVSDKPKTEAEPVEIVPPVTVGGKKRNVYEDSITQEEKKPAARSDQETINELVRMGLQNDWGEEPAEETIEEPDEKPTEESIEETIPDDTQQELPESQTLPEDAPAPEAEEAPMEAEPEEPAASEPEDDGFVQVDVPAPEAEEAPIEAEPEEPTASEPEDDGFVQVDVPAPEAEKAPAEADSEVPAAEAPENDAPAVTEEPAEAYVPISESAQAPAEPEPTDAVHQETKHVIRAANFTRRTTHTTANSAPPRHVVILKEHPAESRTKESGENGGNSQETPSEDDDAHPALLFVTAPEISAPVETAEPAMPEEALQAPAEKAPSEAEEPERAGGKSSGTNFLPAVLLTIVLAAAAIALACASIASFAYGVSGVLAVIRTYTELADRLAAAGISLGAVCVGFVLLSIAGRLLGKTIPSLFRKARGDSGEDAI